MMRFAIGYHQGLIFPNKQIRVSFRGADFLATRAKADSHPHGESCFTGKDFLKPDGDFLGIYGIKKQQRKDTILCRLFNMKRGFMKNL